MKNAPCPPKVTAETQPPKPKAVPILSAKELIDRLWILYRHLANLRCEHVSHLAKLCRIPYETLRGWRNDPKQMLCEVNEEKLARGLGATGSAFRRMLEQTAGEPDWLNICTARWNKCVRFLLAWLPVDLMEMSVLAPMAV